MHVLFQRDNSNITIMRDCSSDYKDAIYLSTYIAAALGGALAPTVRRSRRHDPGRVLLDVTLTLADGGDYLSDLSCCAISRGSLAPWRPLHRPVGWSIRSTPIDSMP